LCRPLAPLHPLPRSDCLCLIFADDVYWREGSTEHTSYRWVTGTETKASRPVVFQVKAKARPLWGQGQAFCSLAVLEDLIHGRKGIYHTTTTVLRPFFRDHPGELVPEENFWTSWCKGRLTEADTLPIRLGATPSGLTSANLHHPPIFLQAGCPSCHPTASKYLRQGQGRASNWTKFCISYSSRSGATV